MALLARTGFGGEAAALKADNSGLATNNAEIFVCGERQFHGDTPVPYALDVTNSAPPEKE